MSASAFPVDRRTHRRHRRRRCPRPASETRPPWLELTEAATLYFGVTLLPLLIVISLYQWGVIA